jgi:hypothetical protein
MDDKSQEFAHLPWAAWGKWYMVTEIEQMKYFIRQDHKFVSCDGQDWDPKPSLPELVLAKAIHILVPIHVRQ